MILSRAEILIKNQNLAETIIRCQILRKQFAQETFIEQESVDLPTYGRIIAKAMKMNEELMSKPLRFVAGDDEYPFELPANKPMIREEMFMSNQDNPEVKEMDNLLALKEIQGLLGAKPLLIISDYMRAWMEDWDKDDGLGDAVKFLKENVDIHFNGGFELLGDDIISYLPHLNVLSPRIYMAFEGSSTIIFICKYGNIHLRYYDESEKDLLAPFLVSKGFAKIEKCAKSIDPEEFYKKLGKMIDDELGTEE